jgi:hypothetical protein
MEEAKRDDTSAARRICFTGELLSEGKRRGGLMSATGPQPLYVLGCSVFKQAGGISRRA